MRILVTNDDGVSAPGLAVAEAIAEQIAHEAAGANGEVWTVAPAFEQSGVSHAISFTAPIKMEQLGPRRFAVSGTPADCVILALDEVMPDTPPDLVLSGVNRGRNLSEDAVYSGTVGAAIEGALRGLKAIALSQVFDRKRLARLGAEADMFEASRAHGAAAVRRLLALEWSEDLFFNVNFPPIGAAEVKGLAFARQGRRRGGAFTPEARVSPGGRTYYWLKHETPASAVAQSSRDDGELSAAGYVTMAPMRPDYTAADVLDRLIAQG